MMEMEPKPRIAWHYTTGDCLRGILASGTIEPATQYVPSRERPVVWFSLNETFEPTAMKGIIYNGVRRRGTLQEIVELANGVYRIGVDARRLIEWPLIKLRARMKPATAKKLVRDAREHGADPHHWLASLDAVPIAGLRVQKLEGGVWVDSPPEAMTFSR